MNSKKRTTILVLPLWVVLILPLLVSIAIGISPRPVRLSEALITAARSEMGLVQRQAMRQILAIEPWRSELWLQIAEAEYQDGSWQNASDAFAQAHNWAKLTPQNWLDWGDAYLQMGDSVKALEIWGEGLIQNDHNALLAERICKQHRQGGDLAAAVEDAKNWWMAAPEDAEAAYAYGLLLAAIRPADASQVLASAAALDESLQSKVNLLRTAIQSGQLESDSAYLYVTTGQALGNLEDWDLAEYAFQAAVNTAPQYAEAWALLGEAQQRLGKNEEGGRSLLKAEKLNPSSALVQALLGFYYRRNEKSAVALVYFQAVARSEPDQPVWEMEIGTTLAGMGDLTDALAHFQRATEIAPKQVNPWTTLVNFCVTYEIDLSGICKKAANQALLIAPDDPAALDGMGQVMFLLGDQISAERFLQQAIQAKTDYAPAYLHLAQVYLNCGERDLAYQELKMVVHLAGEESVVGGQAARLLKQNFSGE